MGRLFSKVLRQRLLREDGGGGGGPEATASNLPPLLDDYRISVVENPGEFKTETKRAGIQMEEYFELGRYHPLKRFTCRLRIALCIAFL